MPGKPRRTMEQPKQQEQRKNAYAQLLDALVEAVRAGGPNGVPGGTLYAALMAHGCSLQQYERLMDHLVQAGRLNKEGHLFFATGSADNWPRP